MLSTGQLLAERYRLTRRIAVGGMGEVWEAGDTRLDRTVAVKILKAELSGDAEFLHRFRTEARTTASLNHAGVAAVHDYGETTEPDTGDAHSIAYLVMELVLGEPLAAILARHGRLTVEFTLDVLEQAGRALQAAHERGLVHRDVKPGNILITTDGTVKLTDFGIAKAADAAPVTRSGMVMGTAHYIAPEQALGQEAESAGDVYSLAVCGYECLMGHRPFLSEHAVTVAMMHIRDIPPPLPADVPPGVRALIEATLVKDPSQRYNSGGEFAAAVAAVRAGHPLPTPSGLMSTPRGVPRAMPVNATGQASQPRMHPVPPPGGPQVGIVGQRRVNPAVWVVLGVLVVALVVAAAVLIPILLSGRDGAPPGGGLGSPQPGRSLHQGRPAWANDGGGDAPGEQGPAPGDDVFQGMMSTQWTKWNGIDR